VSSALYVLLEDGLKRRKQSVFKRRDSGRIHFTRRTNDDADRLKQEVIEMWLAWVLKQRNSTSLTQEFTNFCQNYTLFRSCELKLTG